jgi:ankyrin repeat protein
VVVELGADVNNRDLNGGTPMYDLARFGGYDTKDPIAVLVELGGDVNTADKYGCTPLHGAAEWGHVDTARLLMLTVLIHL